MNKCFQRSTFSLAVIVSCLSNAFAPVLAQGPGVQVIRLNVRDETPAAPVVPAAPQPLQPPQPPQPPQPVATAPTNGSGSNAVSSPATLSANTSSGKTPLAAGASVGYVELANVRDILLDVRRAQTAVAHLYGEVTRHPITGYSYVDAMGPVMFEIPMPTFNMSEVLPARHQWVELYIGEINTVLAYVKADLDSIKAAGADLALPAKDKPIFDKDLLESSASVDRAVSYGEQLKKLAVAPPYDNLAIAKLISPLHKDLKELEKTTKRLIGEIKKSH